MKNLWTLMPPLLADSFGFLEILQNSDGCGILDDSGRFRLHGGHGRREGRRGEHGRPDGRRGRKDLRVAVSNAAEQDVTIGTREKILETFQETFGAYSPRFALFAAGPCGAMIGTDLSEIAETVVREYRIPAATVDLTGQKTYDIGLSRTTEALARLLAQDGEIIPGSVNILGSSTLDWAAEDVSGIRNWAQKQGYQVLSQLGSTVTAAQLSQMGRAERNLVTSVSGLAAARYLQNRLGTPYITAAPFGENPAAQISACEDAGVLIISEQFTANAIRTALVRHGFANGADVATFFSLDKSCAAGTDRKLKGEDDAKALLSSGKYHTVIADPLLRPLCASNCKWIDLPHKALNTYGEVTPLSLLGSNLEHWLDRQF